MSLLPPRVCTSTVPKRVPEPFGSIETRCSLSLVPALDLPSVAAGIVAAQLLVDRRPCAHRCARRSRRCVAVADQRSAEGFHFVLIKGFDLFRRIVGLVLGGNHLQTKTHSANVDVGRVVVSVFVRGTQVRAGINRNAVVRRLLAGIHLQVGERRLISTFSFFLSLSSTLMLHAAHSSRPGWQSWRRATELLKDECCSLLSSAGIV